MKYIKRDPQLRIETQDPFANDLFHSNEIVEDFIELLNATSTPFVHALTAPWGSGKSTFIKICAVELDRRGYTSFVLNVWENENLLDSREAFFSNMMTILQNLDVATKNKLNIKDAFTLAQKPLGILLDLAGKLIFRNIDFEANQLIESFNLDGKKLKDSGENITKAFADLIQTHQSRSKIYTEMRSTLQELVDDHLSRVYSDSEPLPIIIFIDELDRCLPGEVVRFLNNLKHLFELNNVIFVLAIDEEQLTESVRTMYGPNISVHGYLNKFINGYYRLDYTRFYLSYFHKKLEDYDNHLLLKLPNGKNDEYYHSFSQFQGRVATDILFFRLSLRDIDVVVNLMSDFLNRFFHYRDHFEYILFVYLYRLKHPEEFQKFFNRPKWSVLFRDSPNIILLPLNIDYIEEREYFEEQIIPNYIVHFFESELSSITTKSNENFSAYEVATKKLMERVNIKAYRKNMLDVLHFYLNT